MEVIREAGEGHAVDLFKLRKTFAQVISGCASLTGKTKASLVPKVEAFRNDNPVIWSNATGDAACAAATQLGEHKKLISAINRHSSVVLTVFNAPSSCHDLLADIHSCEQSHKLLAAMLLELKNARCVSKKQEVRTKIDSSNAQRKQSMAWVGRSVGRRMFNYMHKHIIDDEDFIRDTYKTKPPAIEVFIEPRGFTAIHNKI